MTPEQRKARLVEVLAELAEILIGSDEKPDPERYYDAKTPGPYLTARAFLDAGRRGDFPTRRVGRRVVALASDVHAAIEAKPPKLTAAKSANPLDRYAKGRAA